MMRIFEAATAVGPPYHPEPRRCHGWNRLAMPIQRRAYAPVAVPIAFWLAIIFVNRLTQQSATDLELIVPHNHSPTFPDFVADIATQNILTGRRVSSPPSSLITFRVDRFSRRKCLDNPLLCGVLVYLRRLE